MGDMTVEKFKGKSCGSYGQSKLVMNPKTLEYLMDNKIG